MQKLVLTIGIEEKKDKKENTDTIAIVSVFFFLSLGQALL